MAEQIRATAVEQINTERVLPPVARFVKGESGMMLQVAGGMWEERRVVPACSEPLSHVPIRKGRLHPTLKPPHEAATGAASTVGTFCVLVFGSPSPLSSDLISIIAGTT